MIICNFCDALCLKPFLNAQCGCVTSIMSKHVRVFSLILMNLAEIIFSPLVNMMRLYFRKTKYKMNEK